MNSRTWAVWINNTVRWYENNYLYVQRRRSVVDVSAVALRLFDVARCRRRHALRARPFQRDAASLVLDHPSVLEVYNTPVPHSRWIQCWHWSHSNACWRCVTFLKHTLHMPGLAEISILRCCCRYPCRRNSKGILFTIRVLIYSVPQSTLVSTRAAPERAACSVAVPAFLFQMQFPLLKTKW